MILGSNRLPFQTPAAAQPGFVPSNPHTGFYSHFNPFVQVMRRMGSMKNAYRPPMQSQAGPQRLPSVPMPAPATAPVPTPGGMAGAFGSTGGTQMHSHVSPYKTMRSGWMAPGTYPSGANIRAGVTNAWSRVDASMPFQTAALPAPPPPPAPAATPTAMHGFGAWRSRARAGVHVQPRKHRWWQLNPPSTTEQVVAQQIAPECEWITDHVSQIQKQICGGRVVAYKDAQGNILRPGDYA